MKSIRRVLIVEPYGIGDLLFLTPIFRALRLLPTVEKVDLLLGSRTESVVKGNPHIDQVFSFHRDRYVKEGKIKLFQDVLSLGMQLKKEKYDLLLDYSLRREYAFFGQFFLGIKRRVGFDYRNRAFFHTDRVPLPDGFLSQHVVDYYCQLPEKVNISIQDRFLEFYLTEEDRALCKNEFHKWQLQGIKKFLVVAPGGGASWGKDAHFKQWPPRFFAELIQQLKKRLDFQGVVLLGSAQECTLTEAVAKDLDIPSLNLAGKIDLRTAAAWIEKATLFLGNDGGLTHLAHALKKPLISIFGPVDPSVYGPYPPAKDAAAIYREGLECRPCYKRFRYESSCPHRDCLQDLQPDQVLMTLDKNKFWESLTPPIL